MARKAHFLTPYVVVLHSAKKANSCNKYAVCRACISVVGKEDSDDDDEMEYDINVINISSLPHPSRDKNAKWRLQDIFVENLGEPNYLSDFK